MAIQRGLRPTSLLLREQPHSEWSELDFVLFEAFCTWESDISKSTGLPTWMTRADSPEVDYEVEYYTDYADEALEKFDRDSREKKGDPDMGVIRVVRPVPTGDHGLPEGGLERERYIKMIMEQQAGTQSREPQPVLPGSEIMIEKRRPKKGYDLSEYA